MTFQMALQGASVALQILPREIQELFKGGTEVLEAFVKVSGAFQGCVSGLGRFKGFQGFVRIIDNFCIIWISCKGVCLGVSDVLQICTWNFLETPDLPEPPKKPLSPM